MRDIALHSYCLTKKKKKDKFYYPYLTDHSYSELSYLAFYSRPKLISSRERS